MNCLKCDYLRIFSNEDIYRTLPSDDYICALIDDDIPEWDKDCPQVRHFNNFIADECFDCCYSYLDDKWLICDIHNCKRYFYQEYQAGLYNEKQFWARKMIYKIRELFNVS